MELKLTKLSWTLAKDYVLIVPFMELKLQEVLQREESSAGLNRTFYGIETEGGISQVDNLLVLIVPFMELKPLSFSKLEQPPRVLIVPFMELKRMQVREPGLIRMS